MSQSYPKFGFVLRQCNIKSVILSLSISPLFGGEFGSQVFFDLNASSQERSISAFQIRRAYLDFRDEISENFSIRVTTDASTFRLLRLLRLTRMFKLLRLVGASNIL